MVKIHNVRVKINNKSGYVMKYQTDWYHRGRLADSYEWPMEIGDGGNCDILNYETDNTIYGCSGYVQYNIGGTVVTIAFANPTYGYNKLGVGTGSGKEVWDKKGTHTSSPFVVTIRIGSGVLDFHCACTRSTTNLVTVDISRRGDPIDFEQAMAAGETTHAITPGEYMHAIASLPHRELVFVVAPTLAKTMVYPVDMCIYLD